MEQGTLKLVTLNLWQFNDWQRRLPGITAILKTLDPDVILLQEAETDASFDPRNQTDLLNATLGYPHTRFSEACIKTTHRNMPLPHPMPHGLGVLSRFPFNTEAVKLTIAPGDTEQRILMKNDFATAKTTFSIANVHFANSDASAEAHLKEAFEILKGRNSLDCILAGDFNIKHLADYKDIYEKTHISSADAYTYVSYPKDRVSYDYMLIPKRCSFVTFQCRDEMVSDHKLLYAEIKI